jgi:hypothetical protein
MPKDKWCGLDEKTKDLWDQIDDKCKSFILGSTKSSSPSPFRTPSKTPFPPKQRHGINLHEMSDYEYLQVHSRELEPDPAPNKITNEESQVDEIQPESSDTLLVNAAKVAVPVHSLLEILESCLRTPNAQLVWLKLNIRYLTIRIHQVNHCHSRIEEPMAV